MSPPPAAVGHPPLGLSSDESLIGGGWESPFSSDSFRLRSRNGGQWRHAELDQLLGSHSLRLAVDSDENDSDPDPGAGAGVDIEDNAGVLLAGEGSVAAELRSDDAVKTCENNVIPVEIGSVAKNEDVIEKLDSEEGSFFDCNICFDLAKEPVVTCCGHLFCWPCIYKWLHIHSDHNECPVCKGEIELKNVTPIYGRGNHISPPEEDTGVSIPVRPSAPRVDGYRQTLQRATSFRMEEMIRRLGSQIELPREDIVSNDDDELPRRAALTNRNVASREMRREQNPTVTTEVVEGTPQRHVNRRLLPVIYRVGQTPIRSVSNSRHVAAALSDAFHHPSPSRMSREMIVETYFRSISPRRNANQEMPPPSQDDRDSFSSIAAVIHGGSQTTDTAVEIDSNVSISTPSSRRRRTSRTSDMDSGDSRRRRLN
ncbi:uncharacterized protein LOC130814980 isoform X2 [Amaranthus tricolor]|nr:uncharacterized protein LOC130814980 isoform X2 [Amaranthus tricolor]